MSHRGILLTDTVLIDNEVIAMKIRNKVAGRILHQQLHRDGGRGRVEANLCPLFALLAGKEGSGTVRDLNLPMRGRSR